MLGWQAVERGPIYDIDAGPCCNLTVPRQQVTHGEGARIVTVATGRKRIQ